jgi:predicted XRE-type DNA-binding protein
MSTKDKLNKIKEIVGGFEKSTWIEEARDRRANSEEIRLRQKIALNILRTIRQLNISQKRLAEMLQVSPQQVNKWVKGTENFAIGTIFKIQTVLDIKLIEVAKLF